MKTRSFISAIISVVVASMLLTGCNWILTTKEAGPLATKEYDLTDFNVVEVADAFKVDISPSDTFSVEITANENVMRYVRVTRNGSTLKIGLEGLHVSFGSRTIEARITMPELTALSLSGASKGTVRGFSSANELSTRISGASTLDLDMETGSLIGEVSGASKVIARIKSTRAEIELSGASTITMDIETGVFVYEASGASSASGSLRSDSVTMHLTGASEVHLTGSAGNLKLSGSGASEAALQGLKVEDADVDLSGAARADLDIDGRLSVSLSGGSKLIYGGNPTMGAKMDISGGSRLEPR
jgi:hypothetical protein